MLEGRKLEKIREEQCATGVREGIEYMERQSELLKNSERCKNVKRIKYEIDMKI